MGEAIFYGTDSEINFVRDLGSHLDESEKRGLHHQYSKVELLQKYLDAMCLRHRWGQINSDTVRAFVVNYISELTGEKPEACTPEPYVEAEEVVGEAYGG